MREDRALPTEGREFQEEARESETHPLSLLGVPQSIKITLGHDIYNRGPAADPGRSGAR